LLIAGIVAWNVLSGDNNGSGVNQVRSDIRSAAEQQQSAIDGIKSVEAGLDAGQKQAGTISAGLGDAAKSINTVEDRIDASSDKLRTSADLIAEGKSIVERVRKRGQSGN
jgi:hypothetical protein